MARRLWAALIALSIGISGCVYSPEQTARTAEGFTLLAETPLGHGSAFAISPVRFVTNHHVSQGGGLLVVDAAGVSRTGHVVLTDADLDLSLLEIDEGQPAFLEAAPLRCERPLAGELVYATGHPLYSRWGTYWGRVASNRPPDFPPGHEEPELVVLDMGVNRGLSGSPVMDLRGRVVGVMQGTMVEYSEQGDRVMAQSALMIAGDSLCGFLGRGA